jgi:hypothetical protein
MWGLKGSDPFKLTFKKKAEHLLSLKIWISDGNPLPPLFILEEHPYQGISLIPHRSSLNDLMLTLSDYEKLATRPKRPYQNNSNSEKTQNP